MPFDRRWLISFMSIVLMTDLQKITKPQVVGLQKLKWLIFLCLTNTNTLLWIWIDPMYCQDIIVNC